MEKTINTRQAGLILVIFTIALKLSVLPSIITDFVNKNSYIVCLIAMLIDFISNIIILNIMKKMPNISFFELIKQTLSKPIAILIYIFMTIYFILKSTITILELHDYYITSLFEEINPFFFILTLTLLLYHLFNRSFRNIGRSLQILFWPMIIGIIFTLIFPLENIELVNLLPIFQDGVLNIFSGLIHSLIGFGDFIILLILMGNIRHDKNTTKSLIKYSLWSIIFVFTFYVIFQGIFGNTAINQTLALSEIPLHNPHPVNIGKLEWLTIIIWTVILIAQVGISGKCACKCINDIIGNNDNKLSSIVIITLMLTIILLTYQKLNKIITITTSSIMSYSILTFNILLILTLIVCFYIYKFKHKEEFENVKSTSKNKKQ